MIFIDRNSPFMVWAVPEGLVIKTKGYFISGASLPKMTINMSPPH